MDLGREIEKLRYRKRVKKGKEIGRKGIKGHKINFKNCNASRMVVSS